MRPIYHRPASPRRGLLGLLAAAALLAAGAAPAGASTLIIEGEGDGHGVGMSQVGALGYAQHGWSDTQILSHYYTGTTIGQAPAGAKIKVLVGSKVVTLGIEQYVRGVVAAEMPSSWPLAALEAQAIASRTYGLTTDDGGSRFDVYADTRSQVYLGKAAETAATNSAIAATAGQIVLYDGQPATTYFFASSGGITESDQNAFIGAAPEPWLVGVTDQYENAAAAAWKVSLTFHTVTARMRGLLKGNFAGIDVLTRGVSPRIVSAQLIGTRGDTPISGPELEARLGLQSAWAFFSVRSGATVRREPDQSSHPPASAPTVPAPATGPVVSAPVTGAGSAEEARVAGGVSAG